MEHRIETHGVEFKVKFNINEIGFNSRLNENMMQKMGESGFYQDLVEVITKDHQISKRQFSFYIMDCSVDSRLSNLCQSRDINKFRE